MNRVRYCCARCGSTDLTFDAAVFWDEEQQCFSLDAGHVYDSQPTCQACGYEGWASEETLP